jgi:hypothetical protein
MFLQIQVGGIPSEVPLPVAVTRCFAPLHKFAGASKLDILLRVRVIKKVEDWQISRFLYIYPSPTGRADSKNERIEAGSSLDEMPVRGGV